MYPPTAAIGYHYQQRIHDKENTMFKYSALLILTAIFLYGIKPSCGYENPFEDPNHPLVTDTSKSDVKNAFDDGHNDSGVLRWQGKYYLYCPYGNGPTGWGQTGGLRVWESTDLVNWSLPTTNLTTAWRNQNTDIHISEWAPEVYYDNGKFYMYTSGWQGNLSPIEQNPLYHNVFSSTNPKATFGIEVENVNRSIDGDIFRDNNNIRAFYFASNQGIRARVMNSMTSIVGSEISIIPFTGLPINDWLEGPEVVNINGTYYVLYVLYNFLDPRYQIYVSNGPASNLSIQTHNPVLKKDTGNLTGIAQPTILLGPDLKTYYIWYHIKDASLRDDVKANLNSNVEMFQHFMLDKIVIHPNKEMHVVHWDGSKYVDGPSFTTQSDPASPEWTADHENRGSDWSSVGPGSWAQPATIFIPPSTFIYPDDEEVEGDSLNKSGPSRYYTNSSNQTSDNFVFESNLKLLAEETTPSDDQLFGVIVSRDASGDNEFQAYLVPDTDANTADLYTRWIIDGVTSSEQLEELAIPIDPNEWHTIRIEKRDTEFKVFVENMLKATRYVKLKGGSVGFIVEDCKAIYHYTAYSNCEDTIWRVRDSSDVTVVSIDVTGNAFFRDDIGQNATSTQLDEVSSDLWIARDDLGDEVARITSDGAIYLKGTFTADPMLATAISQSPSDTIIEWKDSSGSIIAYLDDAGNLVLEENAVVLGDIN